MKLFLHRWSGVGIQDHNDRLSPSRESCGLAGYESVEEIEIEAPEQLTGDAEKLYWKGFECVAFIGKGQVQIYDNYPKETTRIGSMRIISRRAI